MRAAVRPWSAVINRLARDDRGGIAMMFAVALPAIAVVSIGAVELGVTLNHKSVLQSAADAAALAGAGEQSVAPVGVEERTRAFALAQAAEIADNSTVDANVVVLPGGGVQVTMTGHRQSFFGNLLPPGGFNIAVTSTANSLNAAPLCVLGSRGPGDKIINVVDNSRIAATGCLVQANGDVTVEGSGRITATVVQAAGRASGNIVPAGYSGAKVIDDPFANVNLTLPAGCNDTGAMPSGSQTINISPGVHCGKVMVNSGGTVRLMPGEHYFRGAELNIKGSGMLWGRDVVLIFDRDSKITFQDTARVDLEGRRTGALSGFLIVTTRDHTNNVDIWSDNVDNLLGVVYTPAARLTVLGTQAVAEDSQWTVVVAKELEVKGSAALTINTGYAGSPVPVPVGVGPYGGARLSN